MVLLVCVLWALCALCAGTVRPSSRAPAHHLPLFHHVPEPLVSRELFRPVPHKRPLPHGLAALLIPQAEPRQLLDTPLGPVDVWCGRKQVSVRVDRVQLRHRSTPALFRLGPCPVSGASPRYLYFHRGLGECGQAEVVGGQLVYTYSLKYAAPPQDLVVRVPPLNLPISCHYNRFFYSYRVGFQPQVQPPTFLKSIHSKPIFTLTVCNGKWEPLPPGHWFSLGEPVYFLAQTGALLSGERLYVDSCYVTSSEDPSSSPKVDIITNHGCMTDSHRAGSTSHFVSRGHSELRFSIDSFLFHTDSQVLFLHCSMSVGLKPSPSSKSCSFHRAVGRWEELEAPPSVCSCCEAVCTDTHDTRESVRTTVSSTPWYVSQTHKALNMEPVSKAEPSEVSRRQHTHGQTTDNCRGANALKEPCLHLTDSPHWKHRDRPEEHGAVDGLPEQMTMDTDPGSHDVRALFKSSGVSNSTAHNHTVTGNTSAADTSSAADASPTSADVK